jgi:ABC-type nitrate/sulfonate/bicarbonate transport system permease component
MTTEELQAAQKPNSPRFRIIAILIVLGLWQTVAALTSANHRRAPGPLDIAQAWVAMLRSGDLGADFAWSASRVAIGYSAACMVGVVLGLLTARVRIADLTVGTYLQTLRSFPAIALVPVSIVLFGLTESGKYFLIFWASLFPVWINTHLGVRRFKRQFIWAAASLGANKIQILTRVILPGTIGSVIAGMRTSIATAFIALVAAEASGASGGLGFRLLFSQAVYQNDSMFAALATLGAAGALSDALFAQILKIWIPWSADAE